MCPKILYRLYDGNFKLSNKPKHEPPEIMPIPHFVDTFQTCQVSMSWRLLSGLLSGSFSALLCTPSDVVLIRMQAGSLRCRHALQGLLQICRAEGVAALYRGSGPNAWRAALVTMSQVPTYEELKGHLECLRLKVLGRYVLYLSHPGTLNISEQYFKLIYTLIISYETKPDM